MSGNIPSSEQERLILKFDLFAKNIAGGLTPKLPIGYEDARQAARVGLVQAAQRFDLTKYNPIPNDYDDLFKQFAFQRIRGAVIDEARRNSLVKRGGIASGVRVYVDSLDKLHADSDGDESLPFQLNAIEQDLDLWIDFKDAMAALSERERKVIMGLASGARQVEMASELGVTESRVSQIATQARAKLAEQMDLAA